MESTTYSDNSTEYISEGQVYNFRSGSGYWYPIYASFAVGTIGVLANGFVLVVLFGFAKLKSVPCTHLMIHQTVTDTICSAILLLKYTLQLTIDGHLSGAWGEFLCRFLFTENLFWTAFNASSYSLVNIAIERYLMVIHPVFHRNHFTKAVVAGLIILDWVAGAALVGSLPFMRTVKDGRCRGVWDTGINGKASSWSNFTGTYFIPAVILMYSCFCTAYALLKRSQAVGATDGSRPISKGQVNMTITMILVAGVYMVCLTPYQFYSNLSMVIPTFPFHGGTYTSLLLLCVVNCCVNPFIYAVKFGAFKSGVRKMLHMKSSLVDMSSAERTNASDMTRNTGNRGNTGNTGNTG